jgi:hypothetical protein
VNSLTHHQVVVIRILMFGIWQVALLGTWDHSDEREQEKEKSACTASSFNTRITVRCMDPIP